MSDAPEALGTGRRPSTGTRGKRRAHDLMGRGGPSQAAGRATAPIPHGRGTMTDTDCAGIVYRNALVATDVRPGPATRLDPPPAVIV